MSSTRSKQSLRFRLSLLPVFVVIPSFLGAACFFTLNAIEEVSTLDYWFYLTLYAGIGAVSGFATWYFSRLVALRQLSIGVLISLLIVPYAFVMVLSLDKNPIVAILATLIFTVIIGFAWWSRGSNISSD